MTVNKWMKNFVGGIVRILLDFVGVAEEEKNDDDDDEKFVSV